MIRSSTLRSLCTIFRSEPRSARTPVWALPVSLAATPGIDLSFASSGYLDVSVHRVPFVKLWIHFTMTEGCSAGFPHSDICGSRLICSSPQLFAAYHVFHRLLVPRHPPCALSFLTLQKTGMSFAFRDERIAWSWSFLSFTFVNLVASFLTMTFVIASDVSILR